MPINFSWYNYVHGVSESTSKLIIDDVMPFHCNFTSQVIEYNVFVVCYNTICELKFCFFFLGYDLLVICAGRWYWSLCYNTIQNPRAHKQRGSRLVQFTPLPYIYSQDFFLFWMGVLTRGSVKSTYRYPKLLFMCFLFYVYNLLGVNSIWLCAT